jgi:hypothetical protein
MAVLSPPLKVMITGDYLKTAIAIARWGLSDLDPQGSMFFVSQNLLGSPASNPCHGQKLRCYSLKLQHFIIPGVFHAGRGAPLKLCIVKNWHQVGPAHLSALLTHWWYTAPGVGQITSQRLGQITSPWHFDPYLAAAVLHCYSIQFGEYPTVPKYRHLCRLISPVMDVGDIPRISPYPNVHPTCRPWFASRGQWIPGGYAVSRWNSADDCAVEHGTQIPPLFIDIPLRAPKRLVSKDRFTKKSE